MKLKYEDLKLYVFTSISEETNAVSVMKNHQFK